MQTTRPTTGSATRQRIGTRRLGAVVGPLLLGTLVLASCGADDSGATVSTIDLSASSTAFVVRPPATTEAPADSVASGAVVEGTQEYVVQKGDAPLVLVSRFEITLDALLAVNEWGSASEFPFPGETILLPPGAKSVADVAAGTTADADPAATDDPASTDDPAATDETGTEPAGTIPEAGDNCGPGKYTIAADDTTRSKVADRFDVTVEALDAANTGTQGYSAFYPGLEIVIPAKAEC